MQNHLLLFIIMCFIPIWVDLYQENNKNVKNNTDRVEFFEIAGYLLINKEQQIC